MVASVAHIMDLRAQPSRLLIEDPRIATGGQKIDLANLAFGPEPQQFHQPGLGTAHAEAVDNLEDPDWALASCVESKESLECPVHIHRRFPERIERSGS
jgi:hypothetical protein